MKKLILLAIFCFNPLFIEQNISNVYLKSCKKATQKNVWQENGWQENGCRANVLYAAVTRCRNTKKGLVCRPVKKKAVPIRGECCSFETLSSFNKPSGKP